MAQAKGLKTKPPARYSEATLLGAMESAGKQIDDEELRSAMQEKGLGTPATRAAIIEGLLTEKYMLREGRELIPTAKAFQLMTLLRGLEVRRAVPRRPDRRVGVQAVADGKGRAAARAFMQEIAAMTERMVKKAKEYDRDTIPGDYATLTAPCPSCGGIVKENYRRYACTGCRWPQRWLRLSRSPNRPPGAPLKRPKPSSCCATAAWARWKGFRSKAGWPFVAEAHHRAR